MRRIRQLLALHFGAGASTRTIGREQGIAPSTVREYLGRAAAAGVGWPLAADVTDESLVARLFVNAGVRAGARHHAEPDWPAVAREPKRPGVNLQILWDEYRAIHSDGYALGSAAPSGLLGGPSAFRSPRRRLQLCGLRQLTMG